MKILVGQWAAWWRAQWRGTMSVALASAVLAIPRPAAAQFCPGCVQNTAVPQNATFNLTQGATIQGVLTVGTLNLTTLSLSGTLTAAQVVGGGAGITALNASALASGTVPTARVAGAYTGITSVGILTAGTWRGNRVLPAYGGTGADLSLVAAGAVPYFITGGTMAALASPAGPRVLFTAGSGAAPVWVSSPALTGQNFSAIPLTALSNGTLQAGIQVPNASLVSIDAAKVSGNIAGGAAFLTIALPVANLAAGTLPTTNAASSITVTGTPIGTFGGPTTLAQIRVGGDGRVYDVKQFNLIAYSTQIAPGTLPPGVLLPAGQVSSGTLANNVIASSVAATAVSAGTYGGAAKTLTAAVQVDGRLSSLTQQDIALPLSQLNSGTLPGGVLLPAASVNAGTLGASVLAQTLTPNGVGAGVYGSATIAPQLTIDAQGRITHATQFSIPGASTSTAFVDRFNDWHYPQTSRSSWTFTADLKANTITANTQFIGLGSAITGITPANIGAGTLPSNVVASSVAARAVGDLQLTTTAVTAGTKGTAARIPTVVVDAQGRLTSLTDQVVAVTTGQVTGIWQTNQGGFGNDWSAIASGGVPYFSGTGAMSVLPKSVNGYSLTLSGGVPVWSAASSSATYLAGGAANSIPYQTAPNTTAMLAQGTGVLAETAGVPTWSMSLNLSSVDTTGSVTAGAYLGDISSNTFSPERYGAVGNCVNKIDDSVAIQNAVNACGTNSSASARCKLHFPSGCYYTTQTITISSQAYITVEGNGRFNTYIYNVGSTNGAFYVNGGTRPYLNIPSISNVGSVTFQDLAVGSSSGPAITMYDTANTDLHDLFLFSASSTAYLVLDGAAQGEFNNIVIDIGNTGYGNQNPPDPSGYFGTVTFSSPTSDIAIISKTDPGVISGELNFSHIRTGCWIQGDAISVINSSAAATAPTMNNISFTQSDIKAKPGFASWHIDGAGVSISDSYSEDCNGVTDAVYVLSSSATAVVKISNMRSSSANVGVGRLHLNTLVGDFSPASVVQVVNSDFYDIFVDSSPNTLQIVNTYFEVTPGGAGSYLTSPYLTFVGNTYSQGGAGYDAIDINYAGATVMKINNSGGSGVYTTSPSDAWDVTGNQNITGTLSAGNLNVPKITNPFTVAGASVTISAITSGAAGQLTLDSLNNNGAQLKLTNAGIAAGVIGNLQGLSQIDFSTGTYSTAPTMTLDNNGIEFENVTTGVVLCLTSAHRVGHCTASSSCLTTCTCTCTAN